LVQSCTPATTSSNPTIICTSGVKISGTATAASSIIGVYNIESNGSRTLVYTSGNLVVGGQWVFGGGSATNCNAGGSTTTVPAGNYLITQTSGTLCESAGVVRRVISPNEAAYDATNTTTAPSISN
jgi:hypothetical protein